MATISYELVKRWIKDQEQTIPDFPLACVFDFSSMYSTLQFFATDKILMRMGELTSLSEEMKNSQIQTLDWSKCSFPSKFAHQATNDPLFFMIPVFTRGVTAHLSKSETLDLTRHINQITQTIEEAGTQYIFFDLPLIEARQKKYFEIAALLNSNLILGIVDLNKSNVSEVVSEIRTLEMFLNDYSAYSQQILSLTGLVFNKVSEKTLSEKWVDQIMESFPYPVLGMVREDPEFTKIIPQYEIPTTDSMIMKMKCAKDFESITEMIIQMSQDPNTGLLINKRAFQFLESRIFSG
jgi:hypothetical protein